MDATLELLKAGILRPATLPAHYDWVTPNHAALILFLANAGEEGASKAALKKLKADEHTIMDVEVRGLADWLSDRRGKPSHLALTWKGDEVAELLRVFNQAGGALPPKTAT